MKNASPAHTTIPEREPSIEKRLETPVSIVIPTWNGRPLLERFLPSVERALAAYQSGGEIVVVDDGSGDGTTEFLREKFPRVKVLVLEKNLGFAGAVNRGVAAAECRVVVLLNNDVEPAEDFLAPLARHFDEPEVFGVCCKSLDWDKATFRDGGKVGTFQGGCWRVWRNYDIPDPDNLPSGLRLLTFYCAGGFSAFDRGKFLALGGLDELFSPFNWEDTDLCYRGLKRGWTLLYEPRSVVYHRPNTTIGGAFRRTYVRYVSRRNRFLFHWKNLTDPVMLARHALHAALSAPLALLRLDPAALLALFGALMRLRRVRERRRVEKEEAKRTDREVEKMYREFAENVELIL